MVDVAAWETFIDEATGRRLSTQRFTVDLAA